MEKLSPNLPCAINIYIFYYGWHCSSPVHVCQQKFFRRATVLQLGQKEDHLKKNIFFIFTLKLPPLGVGGGVMKFINILSPYPTDATYHIWLRLTQYFLEEDVHARRTIDDERRAKMDTNP